MSHSTPAKHPQPRHDVLDPVEPGSMPVEPDEGPVAPAIPDDPEQGRVVQPAD